jgi:hypothetical protein
VKSFKNKWHHLIKMPLDNYVNNITQQIQRQRYFFRIEGLVDGREIIEWDVLSLPNGYSVERAMNHDVWRPVPCSLQAVVLCPREMMSTKPVTPMHLIYGVQTKDSLQGKVQQGIIAIAPYPLTKQGQQKREWNVQPYVVLLNNGNIITAIGYSGLDDSSQKRGQALTARIKLHVGQTVTEAIDRLIDQYLKSHKCHVTLTDMRVIPRTT